MQHEKLYEPAPPRRGSGLVAATLIASASLVVSLVTSAVVVSRAYLEGGARRESQSRHLSVTGSARTRIISDLSTWEIRVAGEGKTLEEAYQRLEASVAAVQAFLEKRGFAGDAVKLGAIDTTKHYRVDDKGRQMHEVAAFKLSRRFRVTSSEPPRVDAAAGAVTELLKGGFHVESFTPEFIYTKLADLKVRMIGEATANARERADKIATGSGCKVGVVRDARAGVLQITAPNSTETSGGGMHDTSTIEKDVTSVVHLTFTIDAGG